MYWIQARVKRLFVILGVLLIYLFLLIVNTELLVRHYEVSSISLLWLSFSFSTFTALVFLCVASLVWLYVRERRIAIVLFSFSFFMMLALVNESGSSYSGVLELISAISSTCLLPLLALLLLIFPKNHLFFPRNSQREGEKTRQLHHISLKSIVLRSYLAILLIVTLINSSFFLYNYVFHLPFSGPVVIFSTLYFAFGLGGILLTTIITYFRSPSLRERQQLRLFVGGVILTIAPFLLLTVLPMLLPALSAYTVDARLSTLTFVIFPLALGYSILRYQVLVFDSYVQRAVSWLVGVICLVALTYLIVTISSLFSVEKASLYIVLVACVTAFLAPYVWSVAKRMALRLFFNELSHYQRFLEKPARLHEEALDLETVARLLTLSAMQTFETQEVCLFVLHEQTGQYIVSPGIGQQKTETTQQTLLRRIMQSVLTSNSVVQKMQDAIDMRHPIIARLQSSTRPLLLSEIMRSPDALPTGLSRYFNIDTTDETPSTLLAPVRAQGKMIGILVLGERGDHQLYAGPDFEIVQLLLDRYSSILETARLYQHVKLSADLLNSLYQASMLPWNAFQTVEESAIAYTGVAAKAVGGCAEIWLYDQTKNVLQRISAAGELGSFIEPEVLYPSQQDDWRDCFFEGNNEQEVADFVFPSCLTRVPQRPFVWLPLKRDEKYLGVLVLSYPLLHIFTAEEMRVLHMFARQYTVALENTRMTIALWAAYERQKELDVLKDQFIMTASHELRTPLTAVQGYIELLEQYGATLSDEERARFIAKARRGCDELTLMVSNITDASHVHIDAKNMHMRAVSLYDSIVHVAEILESSLKSEKHAVHIEVSSDLSVTADDLRLRQVLLNLVNNAQKYSFAGTAIEIRARCVERLVTISVRDSGAGILPEDHERIFERFVRLERDMNSPVRGAGLGLYVCKNLIKAMGGDIWVESSGEFGQGSTFFFTLHAAEKQQNSVHDTNKLQMA